MYGTCEIDWAKASFSTIYKSYIVSIFICCFFLPVTIMLFSYVSIINTVKSNHTLSGMTDPTDRQRRLERNVTRVSCNVYSICSTQEKKIDLALNVPVWFKKWLIFSEGNKNLLLNWNKMKEGKMTCCPMKIWRKGN